MPADSDLRCKSRMYELSPYDETLYLDVDTVVLNRVGRRAPYYFLDPGSVGAAAVTVNVVVLAAGFVGLGYLLLAVARPMPANVLAPPTDLSSS